VNKTPPYITIGLTSHIEPVAAEPAAAEPAAVEPAAAEPAAAEPRQRPKLLPLQVRFVLDLPSLAEFQKILTIPTVGTELERAEGMSIACRHDHEGALFPGDKSVSFMMRTLTVWQLRLFAAKFEVSQSLMGRREQCFINLMACFLQDPNSVSTSISKRAAALKEKLDKISIGTNRLISTLFSSTYCGLYAQLNNPKDHTGFKITFGPNNKIFWNNVVDSVNGGDNENDEGSLKLLPCAADYVNVDD
jgi:hypothetical protein